MFDSVSSNALQSALDGLAARQRATADNIANINTPHYLAARVDFEGALRSAVNGGTGVARATEGRSTDPTREDGNNVDLETKLREAKEELFNLRFQAATGQLESHGRLRAVKKDIARIYTVVRERELGIRSAPAQEKDGAA